MSATEQNLVSEVSRVVDNYNELLISASGYTGDGTIVVSEHPNNPEELINSVVLSMQETKLNLEKKGKTTLASEVNACVNQVWDLNNLR